MGKASILGDEGLVIRGRAIDLVRGFIAHCESEESLKKQIPTILPDKTTVTMQKPPFRPTEQKAKAEFLTGGWSTRRLCLTFRLQVSLGS